MIFTMPDVLPGAHYSKGDAAKALQVHRNTIRRLIDSGCLKTHERPWSSNPVIFGQDIIDCWRKFK